MLKANLLLANMGPELVLYLCLLGLRGHLLVSAVPIENRPQRIQETISGRFWHISDLHLDPTYHITDDHTKVCFSSQGQPALNPGMFGDFLCDSPYELIQSAFRFMKEKDPHPNFIIWTGDSPPHVPERELSTDTVIRIISNMTHTIREFFPDISVYPALGNHDYWPQDQLPVATDEIYQAVAKLWEPWLQPEALPTLRRGGFYSLVILPKLRLVSLNTNLYYSPNKVTVNMTDPAGQFEWLEATLETCRQSDEKAYIIAHVPIGYLPYVIGTTAMREAYNEKLVEIFRKYSDVVAGQFYGHTHRDSIMVLLDHEGQPVNSVFVTPAVTPFRHANEPYSNNPGLRMYYYNSPDYSLLDVWQYYMNLTEANLERKPDWKLEYIMTKDYNIEDIQPKSLYGLAQSFRTPDSKTFQNYFNHFMVSYNNSIVCKGLCKLEQVCSALFLDHKSYFDCTLKGNSD
ncbi:acid sphingomyelinase-like phosphodiesterase 3a [Anguilla anguilla]|uniref:Acid sphingomyelinase-like phosphodiesterase n=1 Tax=Anguilla anguilla TaxID=7936 RepID=A0A0E9XRD0_ANGAN|nr:acid sphingomyelinase-like phosphodiesterase 3a [Anguilla anguilla]